MKKCTLFLVMLFVAGCGLFAQISSYRDVNKVLSVNEKPTKQSVAPIKQQPLTVDGDVKVQMLEGNRIVFPSQTILSTDSKANFQLWGSKPDGVFYRGMDEETRAYSTYVFKESAAFADIHFPYGTDATGVEISWTIKEGNTPVSLEKDAKNYGIYSLFGIIGDLPVVTGVLGSETLTWTSQNDFPDAVDGVRLNTRYTDGNAVPMSMAVAAAGNYGGVTATEYYGDGMTNDDEDALTGVVSVFDKPIRPLLVKSVLAFAVPVDANAPVTTDGLVLNLYKVDVPNGKILRDEVIATATDLELTVLDYGWHVIKFEFKEKNGPFTTTVDKKIDEMVAVSIEGVDGTNLKFLLSPDLHRVGGSAYMWYGDKLATIGYNNAPNIPQTSLTIAMNAMFPAIDIDQDLQGTMTIPTTGGWAGWVSPNDGETYNDIMIRSSLPLGDTEAPNIWLDEEELPEWITEVEIDSAGYYRTGIIKVYIGTEEAHAGREADVVFHTHAGVTQTIHVVQGTVGIAANKTPKSKVTATANGFELNYAAGFNKATVYNLSGQAVATYVLPASGKYTIPTAGFNKGIYMIQFTGKTTETVKVIR